MTSEFLRANSHASFEAGPPKIFTKRERTVAAECAEDFYMNYDANVEILLRALNKLRACRGKRKQILRVAGRTKVDKVFNITFTDCQNVVYLARVIEVTAWRVDEE